MAGEVFVEAIFRRGRVALKHGGDEWQGVRNLMALSEKEGEVTKRAVLHDEEEIGRGLLIVQQTYNVGMFHCFKNDNLRLKVRQKFLVELRTLNGLDSDGGAGRGVVTLIDIREGTSTDFCTDVVVAEENDGGSCHYGYCWQLTR